MANPNFSFDMLTNHSEKSPIRQFRAGMAKLATDHKLPWDPQFTEFNPEQMTSFGKSGQFYNKVVNFLNTTGYGTLNNTFWGAAGKEGFKMSAVGSQELASMGEGLYQLCKDCEIPEERIASTMENLALIVHRYTNDRVDDHFKTMQTADIGHRNLASIYPSSVTANASYSGALMGREMFGSDMAQSIADIKTAMTLTLLKGYKGLSNRLMHRVSNDTGVVQFVRPNDEFYDLAKSQNKSTAERQSWAHRNQMITLLRHPEPVDMELIPVVPLYDADTEHKYLVANNILKPNVEIPLWDLSMVEGKVGYDQLNYTDLLSARIQLRAVHLKVTKGDPAAGGTTEQFMVNLTPYANMGTFTHMNNTQDNVADRGVMFLTKIAFDKDLMTAEDKRTTIFSGMNRSLEYVIGSLNFNGRANLQSARVYGSGNVEFRPVVSINGADASPELKELVKDITCEVIGWEIDAFYSEENFRKTNMAVRSMTDVLTYTLPDGRTIVVDHAHNQTLPEHALDVAAEVQTIGIDHRNLQLIMKTLKATADRVKNEMSDSRYIENYDNMTVAKSFVSGCRVNPTVMIKTIDFQNVVNFRTSDVLSDLWTYMRACMNTITTEMHYRSLLLQQLEDSAPVYKCITTTPIIDCLWSLASIHENQMPSGKNGEQVFEVKVPGKPTEFKTVLPNGTIIEFVTTAFHYMEDTMILIPYRPNQPQSDLNFAVNYDGGQYSVNWTPTDGANATYRRSMQNTREYPIALNGMGCIINILNRDKYWTGIGKIGQ